jgi:hypothetical protein
MRSWTSFKAFARSLCTCSSASPQLVGTSRSPGAPPRLAKEGPMYDPEKPTVAVRRARRKHYRRSGDCPNLAHCKFRR